MFSSIPEISATGSGTSAIGNSFSATTAIEESTVILGAVLTASYAITAAYAVAGGDGGGGGGTTLTTGSTYPITASHAMTASVANYVPILQGGEGIIYCDDIILPLGGGGYIGEFGGKEFVQGNFLFGNISNLTADYLTSNDTKINVWVDLKMDGANPDSRSIHKLIGTASYADNAQYITQVAKKDGDIEILLGGNLIPDLDYSYTLGQDPLSGPNKLQSVNTYDLYANNIYGLLGIGDSATLHGTSSYANSALTVDKLTKISSSSGDTIELHNSIEPVAGTTVDIGSSGNPINSVTANWAYTGTQYADEISANNNAVITVLDPMLGTLLGTASYSITASYALNGGGGPSVSSSYALTASYALNGGGAPSPSASYASTASWANNLVVVSSAQTTGSYTLVAGDYGKVITFQNATTNSIVIPAGLPTNFNVFLVSTSTGSVLVTGSGVTLNNAYNCYRLSGRYSAASIIGYLADSYILTGDTSI